MKKIVFFWRGLTAYAARVLEELRKQHENVVVVASRPYFPFKGLESIFLGQIVWVKSNSDTRTLSELVGEDYGIVFTSGWSASAFNRWCAEAHRSGRPVVCCVDNDYVFDWKLILKAIRFRLLQRRKFDAFLVAGASGVRFMRFLGASAERIATGLYAGDNQTFSCHVPLKDRPNKIIFVGQYVERKNVLMVCRAFLKAVGLNPGWTLELYGDGPLRDAIPVCESIRVHAFLQQQELAQKYQEAKVFILASVEEHWGVVVHEAALSGCALLLSSRIGAREDFLTDQNGYEFSPFSEKSLVQAFTKIMKWRETDFDLAQEVSCRQAKNFGGEVFARNVLALARQLKGI